MSETPVRDEDLARDRLSDAQLMERARRGDVRAFELLVEAHWDGLVAYAQSMTRDHDSAQDAVQETFTRLWQARAQWRAHRSVRAYLFRAVRNRVIDWERGRRAWERWSSRWRHELRQVRPRGPADALEEAELDAMLERAIAALPQRRREVFVLAHLQDLTYNEIAEVLGLSPQTVANHMSLALRDLRRALDPVFPKFAPSAPPKQQGPAS